MAKVSLGLPLVAAAVGTVVTLFVPAKRLHIICGTAWAALSLVHAWQYRKKLAKDLYRAPLVCCPWQRTQGVLQSGRQNDVKRHVQAAQGRS